MRKNVFLGLLVCVNLALFTALILRVTQPTAAYAQSGGLADNLLVVSAEVTTDNDALYVLDVRKRTLTLLYGQRGARGRVDLIAVAARDLDADFRNEIREDNNR